MDDIIEPADLPDGWGWRYDDVGEYDISRNGVMVAYLGFAEPSPFADEVADALTRILAGLGE